MLPYNLLVAIIILQAVALVISHYRKSAFYVKRWAYRKGILKHRNPLWNNYFLWDRLAQQICKPRRLPVRGRITRKGADYYFHKKGDR